MENKDRYMGSASSQEYAGDLIEAEHSSFIQASCSLPSALHEGKSSFDSFWSLPEITLQPSISAEFGLSSDFERNTFPGKRKADEVEEEVAQSEGLDMWPCSLKEQGDTKLKRASRSAEVHNISERRRRCRIKGKIKVLQELMPHCKKKDRASILEEAANCIKELKHQVETMIKPGANEHAAPVMSCSANPSVQIPCLTPFVPMRPDFGAGMGMTFGSTMCIGCPAQFAPVVQLPVGGFPYSTSAVAGFPLSGMSSVAIDPTTGKFAGERQPSYEQR